MNVPTRDAGGLEWNIQVPLDVRQVYDSWPSAEGGDDDDFNFKISVSDQFNLRHAPTGLSASLRHADAGRA